jgi:hypothetical protein
MDIKIFDTVRNLLGEYIKSTDLWQERSRETYIIININVDLEKLLQKIILHILDHSSELGHRFPSSMQ